MSQSSSHSCSWPALPIRIGASRARVVGPARLQLAIDAERARRLDRRSRTGRAGSAGPSSAPSTSDVPNGCGFSGESDGEVTSHWPRRVFDQRVEEELGGALQQRIDASARYARVAGELVALPEREAQPRAAGRPQPPLRAVDRGGGAPQVGVVVRHPAAARRTSSRAVRAPVTARSCTMRRQRLQHLREVRRHRRPVVHLGVDVDRVLAAPGRRQAVVPDALQVGGLRARPRAGDQQVAAVLEVERRQRRIAAGRERRDPLVGRAGPRASTGPRSSVTRSNSRR